ncbi:MAG: hypothetical protein H0V00_06910 [Chloroflexia bacterium]|nr:hypothetical protein [Chloroflexia bacterium]
MAFFRRKTAKQQEQLPVAVVRGASGDLQLYEHMVRIQRKNQGKDILLSTISSVHLSRPGFCAPGYLKLTFPGSQETRSLIDENTVTFKRSQQKAFDQFKAELDRRVLAARTASR